MFIFRHYFKHVYIILHSELLSLKKIKFSNQYFKDYSKLNFIINSQIIKENLLIDGYKNNFKVINLPAFDSKIKSNISSNNIYSFGLYDDNKNSYYIQILSLILNNSYKVGHVGKTNIKLCKDIASIINPVPTRKFVNYNSYINYLSSVKYIVMFQNYDYYNYCISAIYADAISFKTPVLSLSNNTFNKLEVFYPSIFKSFKSVHDMADYIDANLKSNNIEADIYNWKNLSLSDFNSVFK